MKAATYSGKVDPVVRKITIDDVKASLKDGIEDFKRAPRHGLALGAITAATGTAIVALLYVMGLPYLAYPIAAGFALVCPFLAAGLYEVSRRLERGESHFASEVWSTIKGRSENRSMGFATLFILIMWMYQVRFLMALILGYSGMMATLSDFLRVVFTTSEGLLFLALGNVIGALLSVFAVLYFCGVVSARGRPRRRFRHRHDYERKGRVYEPGTNGVLRPDHRGDAVPFCAIRVRGPSDWTACPGARNMASLQAGRCTR